MDNFLERFWVSIVHVGFREVGTRALIHIPQRWRLIPSGKGLRHRRPFVIGILRARQEAARSQIQEFMPVRIGCVAELVEGARFVKREGRIRRLCHLPALIDMSKSSLHH